MSRRSLSMVLLYTARTGTSPLVEFLLDTELELIPNATRYKVISTASIKGLQELLVPEFGTGQPSACFPAAYYGQNGFRTSEKTTKSDQQFTFMTTVHVYSNMYFFRLCFPTTFLFRPYYRRYIHACVDA